MGETTYYRRKKQHKCVRCAVQLADDWKKVLCEQCDIANKELQYSYGDKRKDYMKLYNADIRKLRRKFHLCAHCGKFMPKDYYYQTCQKCRDKFSKNYKERKANEQQSREKKDA